MFSVNKKRGLSINNQRIDTLIGVETSITGTIHSDGVLRVDGVHNGDIDSKDDVVIGDGGKVNGNIYARNVSVSGEVKGNIICKGVLEILSTGIVDGDVQVEKLTINEGAIFNGKCIMCTSKEGIAIA